MSNKNVINQINTGAVSGFLQGVCHDGKIEPLEKIPYKTDKNVIIVFLDNVEDRIWEDAVAADFMKGYSEKDAVYDKL